MVREHSGTQGESGTLLNIFLKKSGIPGVAIAWNGGFKNIGFSTVNRNDVRS